MAATIAIATGTDTSRRKETHRLGSQESSAQANTWRTFTSCHVKRDGSGYISVYRDGTKLLEYVFGPE